MRDVQRHTRWRLGSPIGVLLLAVTVLSAGCAGKGRVDAYNDYAIAAAKNRLWREAASRWEQALDLDPSDHRVWNNLGVAYEADERFDDAIRAYTEATSLDAENSHYVRNLRRCERNRDRVAAVGDTEVFPPIEEEAIDDFRDDDLRDEDADDEFDYPRERRNEV